MTLTQFNNFKTKHMMKKLIFLLPVFVVLAACTPYDAMETPDMSGTSWKMKGETGSLVLDFIDGQHCTLTSTYPNYLEFYPSSSGTYSWNNSRIEFKDFAIGPYYQLYDAVLNSTASILRVTFLGEAVYFEMFGDFPFRKQ